MLHFLSYDAFGARLRRGGDGARRAWRGASHNAAGARAPQTCPTLTHGSDTYVNDGLYSRAEGALLSLVTLTSVYDCHGALAYTFRTGGVWDTVVNKVTYQSSFQMFNANGTLLAFTGGSTFITDDIALYDMRNAKVATLVRDTLSVNWVWNINVLVPGSPATDWRVLTAVAGVISFNQSGNDICNKYFWTLAWVFLGLGIVIFLLGVCAARVWYTKRHGKVAQAIDLLQR